MVHVEKLFNRKAIKYKNYRIENYQMNRKYKSSNRKAIK